MSRFIRSIAWVVALGVFAATVGAPSTSVAQTTLRVPDDYASIQAAVDAATTGDTIVVGSGTWCGAVVTKRLVIRGEANATITGLGCSGPFAPAPAPGGIAGFLLQKSGTTDPSGTTIEHFTFSDVYTGINAVAAGGVIVQHNTIQPNRIGIFSRNGSGWTVAYNRIENRAAGAGIINSGGSGWMVVHNDLVGTFVGILLQRGFVTPPRASNNTVSFNHVQGALNGEGIGLLGQDGAMITNNNVFVPTSADFQDSPLCGGWGIAAWHTGPGPQGQFLTSINSTITNNDTRDTKVGLYVVLDPSGSPGNAEGLLLRGNFGTLALNQPDCDLGDITGVVKSRAISTLIACDDDGICQ